MEVTLKISKFIYKLADKVGGFDKLIFITLLFAFIACGLMYKTLDHAINVFENMCFYDYPANYTCSCG
ncbi:MAG: hypothetical protein ACOCRX_04170 [Candidatus Woesearchaeota archaeon]